MKFFTLVCSIAFALSISYVFASSEDCLSVKENDHYADDLLNPLFKGFVDTTDRAMLVTFEPNTVEYLFSYNETDGPRCQYSWNKLWGNSRCGYLNPHHKDSDRFVWRRHADCIQLSPDGQHVEGVVPDCPYADQIQIAAYAYNASMEPFQHDGVLLKTFEQTLTIGQTYLTKLHFYVLNTTYTLWTEDGSDLLETQVIEHRDCGDDFDHGYKLGLYFGGVCTAPSEVSVCYSPQ